MNYGAAAWHFVEQNPMHKNREAVQGQFFATASIENVADSLVRESVQNSLDAHDGSTSLPGIRYHLRSAPGIPTAQVGPYFEGMWPHVAACNADAAKLQAEPYCRTLVIEDRNTTGLTGDPLEFVEPDDRGSNHFYYFFRAEGRSSKTGASRGSWGIGKFTFPAASRINTFFALTCRGGAANQAGGNGPLVMGQSILTTHKVGPIAYTPDAWWSELTQVRTTEVPTPAAAPSPQPGDFRAAFDLGRTSEPGLSVVVPYVHKDMTPVALQRAVLKNYGVALAHGLVEIEVTADDELPLFFTQESLDTEIKRLDDEKLAAEVKRDVDLARLAHDRKVTRIELPPFTSSPWKPDTLEEHYRRELADAVNSGKPFVVEVPVEVTKKAEPRNSVMGLATIVFEPNDRATSSAYYREGLRISEVKGAPTPGFGAMLIVGAGALAEMLGDAEGPSHVDWTARTDRFAGKYKNGQNHLAAIKRLPATVIQAARHMPDQVDRTLGISFFSAPPPPAGTGPRKAPTTQTSTKLDIPPSEKQVRVNRLDTGFSLRLPTKTTNGDTLNVAFAYDVRTGQPLKRWSPADFTFDDLSFTRSGFEITQLDGNMVAGIITDRDNFTFSLTGFDGIRDLFIRPVVQFQEGQ